MTVVVDINVLLDVFQNRLPHYRDSAIVVDSVITAALKGCCPSHGIATIYYLVEKHGTSADATAAVDMVLKHFDVIGLHKADWQAVRSLNIADLEDAAVAQTAHLAGAAFIVTRNVGDFAASPVPAISPTYFINRFLPPP